jgi:hypothetical protein
MSLPQLLIEVNGDRSRASRGCFLFSLVAWVGEAIRTSQFVGQMIELREVQRPLVTESSTEKSSETIRTSQASPSTSVVTDIHERAAHWTPGIFDLIAGRIHEENVPRKSKLIRRVAG